MVVGISLEDLPGHYPPSMLVGTIYGIALLRLRSLMRSQWIAELGLSLRPPATLETQAVDFAYPTRPPVDLRRSLTVLAAPLHRHAPPARLLNPLIRGEAVAA